VHLLISAGTGEDWISLLSTDELCDILRLSGECIRNEVYYYEKTRPRPVQDRIRAKSQNGPIGKKWGQKSSLMPCIYLTDEW
jgi:hypothetical protein